MGKRWTQGDGGDTATGPGMLRQAGGTRPAETWVSGSAPGPSRDGFLLPPAQSVGSIPAAWGHPRALLSSLDCGVCRICCQGPQGVLRGRHGSGRTPWVPVPGGGPRPGSTLWRPLIPALSAPSSMNSTGTLRGRSSWTTCSASCRNEVSARPAGGRGLPAAAGSQGFQAVVMSEQAGGRACCGLPGEGFFTPTLNWMFRLL